MENNILTFELKLIFSNPVPEGDRAEILKNVRWIIDHFGLEEGNISPEDSEYGCDDFTVKLVSHE
jgi:hypothetical protein